MRFLRLPVRVRRVDHIVVNRPRALVSVGPDGGDVVAGVEGGAGP